MLITIEGIDLAVSKLEGTATWVKRKNLRNKLTAANNKELDRRIGLLQKEIREKKARGYKQRDLTNLFSMITELEFKII